MRFRLSPDPAGIGRGLDIIEEKLTKYGLKRKDVAKSMLAAEEVMVSLLKHAEQADGIHLSIRRIFEDISIEVAVAGREFSFEKELSLGTPLDTQDMSPDAELSIRNMILRSVVDDLKYRNRSGINTVRITVVRSKRAMLYQTLGAMVLAILLGVVLRLAAPEVLCTGLNDMLLVPVKTMFMNALKMIVTPVVFFSIVSCIGQFSDLSEMGKIGGRVIGLYLMTTVLATAVGVGMFYLFRPGNPAAAAGAVVGGYQAQELEVSFIDTIVGIVPGNIVKPFLEANMLQLIFLAVLCGIAVGMIGKYSKLLSELFTACNELFLKITVLLVRFMPLAAFCSILSMMLQTGTQALVSIVSIFSVFVLGLAVMMAVYCLMMLVFARLNPVPFGKKYAPTMVQVFSMASSNAALPLNIDACKKMGVSPKVYSLSLPLGATINMDGTCIYLSVVALSLARVYGMEIPAAALMSVVISIIVLSIGAPGVPGSGLICLSVLLTQLGVPVEAVGLVMGIDPLVGMLRCMSNCLGDVAVSCIVAKREGILDMDTYRKGA